MFTIPELVFHFLWVSVFLVLAVIFWLTWRGQEADGGGRPVGSRSFFLRIRLVWNNLWRKPLRTLLLVASSAITAGILFLGYFFLTSMDRSLSAAGGRLGADVMVVPKGYGVVAQQILLSGAVSSFYMPESVVDKVRAIPRVAAASPQLYLETYSGSCCQVEGNFPVVAFDPLTDFTLKPWLANAGNRPFGEHSIIIGSEAGGKNAIYHLDNRAYEERLHLFGQPFVVSHLLYPTGTGVDQTIFMDIRKVRELRRLPNSPLRFPDHSVSVVLVKTQPGDEEWVRREIERRIPEVSAVTGAGMRETVEKQLFPLRLLSFSMIGIVLVMAGLQAMTLFSAVVSERKREIGMFRALGARKADVYRLLLQEAALAGVIGGAAGALAMFIVLYDNRTLIRKLIQLPLLFPDWGLAALIALAAVAFTAGLGMLAASVPIRSIVKQEPYLAIREGE
ncbi:ABC transporter permease [Effusibacillus pohliae]|uniref:ABC transporter permease n=1 Tax=Effusibacillus pohliae TaxID=232270 RepID=UPI00036EBFEA|nr:ABC transporter permease [Effusibacillus pohliae]